VEGTRDRVTYQKWVTWSSGRVTNFWYVTRSRVPYTLSRYGVKLHGNVTSVDPAFIVHWTLHNHGVHAITLYILSHVCVGVISSYIRNSGRGQLKCDGTPWLTGGEVKGKLANGVGSQYPSHYLGTWCVQHYYSWYAHLGCQYLTELTPPADLNGLVRFSERRNLVSARLPSHFNWPLQHDTNLELKMIRGYHPTLELNMSAIVKSLHFRRVFIPFRISPFCRVYVKNHML